MGMQCILILIPGTYFKYIFLIWHTGFIGTSLLTRNCLNSSKCWRLFFTYNFAIIQLNNLSKYANSDSELNSNFLQYKIIKFYTKFKN